MCGALMNIAKQIGDWFDERTGWRRLRDEALLEPIPGGARWAYIFGSGLAFTFVLQAVTGITMAMYFSPSATDAWASVWYLQTQVTWGSIVRGLHHFGSSAMVVLAVVHMVQVFVFGAYRKPRELNWIFGVVLLFLVLGFSLTGYLLPWDQKGYWATQVATKIMGSAPVLGEYVQRFMQGGTEYGNLTLTRFYALHVFVLPALLVLVTVGHIYLFRRHGVTTPPGMSEAARTRVDRFWPAQVFKDTVLAVAILGTLLALAIFVGAPLDQPADPTSNYEARPEWYFLFLFQLLKYFEGPMALIGTIVIPTAGALFLFLLPFLDRAKERTLRARMPVVIPFVAMIGGAGALTAIAIQSDANSDEFQKHVSAQDKAAKLALDYAAIGGVDDLGNIILMRGHHIMDDRGCFGCHAVTGISTPEEKGGPELSGFLSREWFLSFLKNPDSPRHFGGLKAEGTMPSFAELPEADLLALTEMLVAESGISPNPPLDADLVAKGRKVFAEGDCSTCHSLTREAVDGPALGGFGSDRWLKRLLIHPDAPDMFGEYNEMPSFEDELSDADMVYVLAYLRYLRDITPAESADEVAKPAE